VTSPDDRAPEISALMDRLEQGDAGAAEALFAELYSELHRQRRRHTRDDRMGGAAEG
jgi:ECF sigma factor